ncbi:hypothetical protein Bbelb_343850 [Branchiostoma belcheri]|nr:hypothetical protein Bbelb_343850 [Branchiostoma belcheri]
MVGESSGVDSGVVDDWKKKLPEITCMTREKEQPLIIGKSAKPRCFKNVNLRTLPVIFRNNSKAWMNRTVRGEAEAPGQEDGSAEAEDPALHLTSSKTRKPGDWETASSRVCYGLVNVSWLPRRDLQKRTKSHAHRVAYMAYTGNLDIAELQVHISQVKPCKEYDIGFYLSCYIEKTQWTLDAITAWAEPFSLTTNGRKTKHQFDRRHPIWGSAGDRGRIDNVSLRLRVPVTFQNELRSYFDDVITRVSGYKVYIYINEPTYSIQHMYDSLPSETHLMELYRRAMRVRTTILASDLQYNAILGNMLQYLERMHTRELDILLLVEDLLQEDVI